MTELTLSTARRELAAANLEVDSLYEKLNRARARLREAERDVREAELRTLMGGRGCSNCGGPLEPGEGHAVRDDIVYCDSCVAPAATVNGE